jgi:hypothetical protein
MGKVLGTDLLAQETDEASDEWRRNCQIATVDRCNEIRANRKKTSTAKQRQIAIPQSGDSRRDTDVELGDKEKRSLRIQKLGNLHPMAVRRVRHRLSDDGFF